MTRSELDRILSRGRLFCDLWAVAYFLRLTWNQAHHMYNLGRFPKVLGATGEEWRPAGTRLIDVAQFAEMVPGELQAELSLWRQYGFEIGPHRPIDEVPPLRDDLDLGAVSATSWETVRS